MIEVLVKKKLVAQKGKARDVYDRRRKRVSQLGDEILGAMVFADREAGNSCARSGQRIEQSAVQEHITEAQSVAGGEIVVDAHSGLVLTVAQYLTDVIEIEHAVGIGGVGERVKPQHLLRGRVDAGNLVARKRRRAAGGKQVEERAVLGDVLREIPLPLEQGGHAHIAQRFALAIAEALVIPEEKRLVPPHGAAQRGAELVLPVFGLRKTVGVLKEVRGIHGVVAHELPHVTVQMV